MGIIILKNDKEHGPFDESTVREALAKGAFSQNDLCWQDGCENWLPLGQFLNPDEKKSQAPPHPPIDEVPVSDAVKKFLCEQQDWKVVDKIHEHASSLLAGGEEILYIAVQKKPLVTFKPECIVYTNQRIMVYHPGLLGMTFDDHAWRNVNNVLIKENLIGATVTLQIAGGRSSRLSDIPTAQARKLYAIGHQKVEDRRLQGGNLIKATPAPAPASVFKPHPAPQTALPKPDPNDPTERLAKLKTMLDRGLISIEEFESKKSDILSSL